MTETPDQRKLELGNFSRSILIIGSTPPPYGGGEVMNEVLVRGLRKISNYRVVHINTSDNRGNANRGKIDFANVGKGILNLLRLIKCAFMNRPDIVYIPIAKSFVAFFRDSLYIISSKLFGAKVVCHLHGGYFQLNNGNGIGKAYVNFALKKIHTLIVLGGIIERRLEGRLPVRNFAVLYNGIRPIVQAQSHVVKRVDERFRVLFIGNLSESKGFLDILRAVPLVLRETDQFDFWFAGEWPSPQEKAYALGLIEQSEIGRYTKFWGLVAKEEKIEFFNRGHVLVHPTYYDGQPIVILEAMSAGLPIISTDVGSIAETVVDGKNGFIIPTGRPDKIADKLLLLYRDEELRIAMSSVSKQIYQARFTEEIFLANIQRVFERVFSEKEVRSFASS